MAEQSLDRVFGSADRWRKQASDMRVLAEAAVDETAKEKLLLAAQQYDQLAIRAEAQSLEVREIKDHEPYEIELGCSPSRQKGRDIP
jgi:hypothetical protein